MPSRYKIWSSKCEDYQSKSIKQFVFGASDQTNSVYSRKRRRDENCDLDGEDPDVLVSSVSKKQRTEGPGSWHIRGMPSILKNKMAWLLENQKKQRSNMKESVEPLSNRVVTPSSPANPSPGIDAMPGDFKGLTRPSIHVAGKKSSKSYLDSLALGVESELTDVTSKTSLQNGTRSTGMEYLFTPVQQLPDKHPSSRVHVRANTSSYPAHQFKPNKTGFLPLYDKTFNSSQTSGRYGSLSVLQKKQLEEKETYKQLLKQFSTSSPSFNCAWSNAPFATSTPYVSGERSLSRRITSPSREIPVITLEDSHRDTTFNKSVTMPLEKSYIFQKFQPKETKTEERGRHDLSRLKLTDSPYLVKDWVQDMKNKFSQRARDRASCIAAEQRRIDDLEEKRLLNEKRRQEKIQQRLLLARREVAVLEEDEFLEEEEEEFPELTDEMEDEVSDALIPRPDMEILSEAFKIQIRRKDMQTLSGLNWLNDEVINFYLSMLVERGTNENYPSVHAFNTFFYPKLLKSGYSSVRRWTKKVDIFSHDILLVPIHLGMHWCLATVDFKKKSINYYDSMGGDNMQCLNTLRQYLYDESMDKLKSPFDLTGWQCEVVKGIPEQLNGSDCGMFTCKYAEYITRGASITFTQEHMPYFRRRMVYEILKKRLL